MGGFLKKIILVVLVCFLIGGVVFTSGCTSSGATCPVCNSTNTHVIAHADDRDLYKCDNCGAEFGVYHSTGTQQPG